MRQGSSRKAYDVPELERELRAGRVEPVYAVLGGEPLLAEEAIRALVETCVAAGSRDFNLSYYSGDDDTGSGFLAQARSYPFLAERRLVVVRRFDKLSFKDGRAEAALLEYLARPAASTVLVLVAPKLDRRFRITQAVEKSARVVTVEGIPERAVPEWVRARFAALGLEAGPQACTLLVQLVGTSLLDIKNEIDKVALRYAGRSRVGEPEIGATVGRYRQEEVWAINRAFRPDNMAGFLQVLSRILDVDDEPIRIAAVLARQLSNLLRVKLLHERGTRSYEAVARRLGLPPFAAADLARQAGDWSRAQLMLWLRNLQRADLQMKSLRLPPRWVLERALVNSFLGEELA